MLNTKRSFNNNVYNASKSRNKSIYRGDQSHTLSMHLRIDNEVSPTSPRSHPNSTFSTSTRTRKTKYKHSASPSRLLSLATTGRKLPEMKWKPDQARNS